MALLRPLISRSTYRGWAWLILGGAVLMPYMMAGEVVGVMLWGAQADELTLPVRPATFLLVLPVVLLTGLVLPVRPLLTVTARSLLGAHIPPATGGRDAATRWRTAAWYTIHLAVGGVLAGVTLALVPFVVLVAVLPLWPDPREISGDLLGAGWQLWWGPVFGPLALLTLVYLVACAGAVLRRLAPVLLGPGTAERLAAARQEAARLATRNRLARELHDSVGHALSVVTLQAGAAGRMLDREPELRDPDFVRKALNAVEETARRALADLDHALGVLRQDTDRGARGSEAPQPDLAQLPALLENCGLRVETDLGVDPGALPGSVSREAYRIIQEALTNAVRHGADRTATLRLGRIGDDLTVEVSNPAAGPNGPAGAAASGAVPGRGLTGMAERVAVLGGTLHTGPTDGHWHVSATLPVRWSA